MQSPIKHLSWDMYMYAHLLLLSLYNPRTPHPGFPTASPKSTVFQSYFFGVPKVNHYRFLFQEPVEYNYQRIMKVPQNFPTKKERLYMEKLATLQGNIS